MHKIQLLTLLLTLSLFAAAQDKDEPSFTSSHRSTTISYGLSALLGYGAYSKDAGASKSVTAGPVSLSFNKALTEDISFHWGPSIMYYRYNYSYEYSGGADKGSVDLLFGGLTLGVAYHVPSKGKFDPYAGISAGAGYYYDLKGKDESGYSLGGSVPLLYGANLGLNIYGASGNAWTVELGYDYLSYLKVGYTFARSK